MVFSQSEWFRGSRRLELSDNDDILHIRARDGRASKSFTVPLAVLREDPAELRANSIAAIVFFCGFGVAALIGLSGVITGPVLGAKLASAFMMCLFGFAATAGFARWRQLSFDVIVFYNRFNASPVFNLYRYKPDRETFDGFVAALVKRIRAAQAGIAMVECMSIPAQIEAYARLAERGLISSSEFGSVKQRLLESAMTTKQIGFQA